MYIRRQLKIDTYIYNFSAKMSFNSLLRIVLIVFAVLAIQDITEAHPLTSDSGKYHTGVVYIQYTEPS